MLIQSNKVIKFFELLMGMKISAIAIFPFIFASEDIRITDDLLNHERIHLRQQIELLIIPFYIIYLIEFYKKGYMNISFEKEAYQNDKNLNYLKTRKLYNFIKYYKSEN